MNAARQLLHSTLADATPGTTAYVYRLEGSAGGPAGAANPFIDVLVQRNAAELQLVVAGLPGGVHDGHVTSSALSTTLKLKGQQRKQGVAMRTALQAFSQAAPHLR